MNKQQASAQYSVIREKLVGLGYITDRERYYNADDMLQQAVEWMQEVQGVVMSQRRRNALYVQLLELDCMTDAAWFAPMLDFKYLTGTVSASDPLFYVEIDENVWFDRAGYITLASVLKRAGLKKCHIAINHNKLELEL